MRRRDGRLPNLFTVFPLVQPSASLITSRERELAEEQDVHHRYMTKMQTYADQVGRII